MDGGVWPWRQRQRDDFTRESPPQKRRARCGSIKQGGLLCNTVESNEFGPRVGPVAQVATLGRD